MMNEELDALPFLASQTFGWAICVIFFRGAFVNVSQSHFGFAQLHFGILVRIQVEPVDSHPAIALSWETMQAMWKHALLK